MDTALQQRFGRRVRRLREATGLSQEDFANKHDFGRSWFGRLERGEANPSLATLAKLAAAFGMSLSRLLDFSRKA